MAKKIQVELTTKEARALLASQPENKAAERALDDAQLKLADEMLRARHGR